MTHFSSEAVKSYALAAFVSLYSSVMILAIVGHKGAEVGQLVI